LKSSSADKNVFFFLSDDVDLPASAAAARAMTDSEEARKENRHSTVVEEAGGTDRDRNENKVDDVQVWRDWQTAAVISFIECHYVNRPHLCPLSFSLGL
jgi:hypothetical protein